MFGLAPFDDAGFADVWDAAVDAVPVERPDADGIVATGVVAHAAEATAISAARYAFMVVGL